MNAVFADSRINAARDALNEVVDLVDGQTVEGEVVVANSASDPSVEPLPLSLTPRQSIVRDQMTSILVRQEVMRRRY
ncbi:hypothetical protein KAR91_19135 [Candidatus Pacearchaeota archaeon]|nr:hypothetical protein [Candidatus Pacearchaeota archaeon]